VTALVAVTFFVLVARRYHGEGLLRSVRYQVSGDASHAQVIYVAPGPASMGTEQHDMTVPLPWSTALKVGPHTSLSVVANGTGSLTCTLIEDGKTVASDVGTDTCSVQATT
jgi:hypothetical protein